MKIVGRLSEMGQQQISLYDGIDGKLADRAEKRERKRQLREQLDDIGDSLSDIETEDIAGLESRRETLQEDIEGYTEDIGALEAERDRLMDELAEVKRDKAEAEEEDETADRARRRAQTAEYLGEQVEALFERYQNRVRESVNDRVNSTFRSIIEKQYYAQISADYDLRILKDVGDTQNEDVAKSTGERQVASLSFIASLVSLAKDRYESEEDATYFSGGIYPMLMDSPFGYLDPTYQERVSQTLPDMGEQVIVLVTESQWSEAVAGEMAKIAGQQYELDYQAERDYDATDIVAVEGSA
jgi:DNA sulfur modification protein DndD